MRVISRSMALGCLGLSMALVGSYVALSKPLAMLFPVALLAWLRFAIGAVAMVNWLRKPPEEPPITSNTLRWLFLESLFGNFLFTICMVVGVSLTSAVTAGVTMAAIPAAVAVMSFCFLQERITPRIWLAVALAVIGIAMYAVAQPDAEVGSKGGQWWGQLLLLGAVLCEAAYAVIGKRLSSSLSPKRISAIINLWGLALSTPLGLYFAWKFNFAQVGVATWGLLVFYALAACVWTVWLWMTGLRVVPASQAGVMTVMLPVSAAIVGVWVLGESITYLQLVALAVALLGVVVATWPSRSVKSTS